LSRANTIKLDKASTYSVELRNTSLNFGPKVILDSINLSVLPGAKISLMCENSSGKSTILKVMAGLIPPESGQVFLFGQEITKASHSERDRLWRKVGMQFQAGAMFDSMTVMDNLALASQEGSRGRQLRKIGPSEIQDLLDQVGLAHAAKLKPSELSGGMRKRAALARALIAEPELALFDEPTAGLDPITANRIIMLLKVLSSKHKAAMILATSDVDVARRFSTDLILMKKGRIVTRGSLEDLMASPDPYVVNYLSRYKLVDQAISGEN
jgi:phospholipid/cholesterol/gamma-HCH transport system ATP-binding protein